jgi:hypothetical protein
MIIMGMTPRLTTPIRTVTIMATTGIITIPRPGATA